MEKARKLYKMPLFTDTKGK